MFFRSAAAEQEERIDGAQLLVSGSFPYSLGEISGLGARFVHALIRLRAEECDLSAGFRSFPS
jgi:hypothetical protein